MLLLEDMMSWTQDIIAALGRVARGAALPVGLHPGGRRRAPASSGPSPEAILGVIVIMCVRQCVSGLQVRQLTYFIFRKFFV